MRAALALTFGSLLVANVPSVAALGAPAEAAGTVLLPDGAPAGNAEVWLVRDSGDGVLGVVGDAVRSGPDGRFRIAVPPGDVAEELRVLAQGPGGVAVAPLPEGGGALQLVLTASPGFNGAPPAPSALAGAGVQSRVASILERVPSVEPLDRLAELDDLGGDPEAAVASPPDAIAAPGAELPLKGHAGLDVPEPRPTIVGFEPTVTFYVNGRTYLWVVQAPFPVDINNDRVVDGTLQAGINVLAGVSNPLVCFSSDLTVGKLLRRFGGVLGVIYAGRGVFFKTGDLPTKVSLCGRTDRSGAFAEFTITSSPRTPAPFAIEAIGNNQDLIVVFDKSPVRISGTASGVTPTFARFTYTADTTYTIQVQYTGPLFLRADLYGMPTNIRLDFERTQSATSNTIRIDYTAAATMDLVEAKLAASPVATDHIYAYVQGIPSDIEETIRIVGDTKTLTEASLSHGASGRINELYGYAQYQGTSGWLYLVGVPTSVNVNLALRDPSGSKATPSFSYAANAAGLNLYAYATGTLLSGGYAYARVLNLPTSISTTFPSPGSGEVLRVVLSTQGTGAIGQVYIDANLPALLPGPLKRVVIYMEQLASLDLRQKSPMAACIACQYWEQRSAGYFWFYHGEIQFGGFHIDVYWKADQCPSWASLDACDALGLWSTKYFVTSANYMVHYPPFLSPSDHTRASIWFFI